MRLCAISWEMVGSDSSEPAISHEMAQRRMSLDMFGPMSSMPDGTTLNTQVANASLPAGAHQQDPIFISGVNDTRAFLAWLQGFCYRQLMAQLKAQKLVVVPATADGFRAAVSALRSLDWKSRVSFHTSLPEERCVRLFVKNLGKRMPESVVLKELGSLGFHVQGVMQLRSGRRGRDPAQDRPPTPTSLSVTRGPEVSKVRALTGLFGLRVSFETFVAPKGPVQCKQCHRFGHTQRNCGHAPRCVACGGSHLSGDCPARPVQPLLHLWGQPHSELPGLCEMERG